ncbi:unnamed protein product, partial [Allacma fusca]
MPFGAGGLPVHYPPPTGGQMPPGGPPQQGLPPFGLPPFMNMIPGMPRMGMSVPPPSAGAPP